MQGTKEVRFRVRWPNDEGTTYSFPTNRELCCVAVSISDSSMLKIGFAETRSTVPRFRVRSTAGDAVTAMPELIRRRERGCYWSQIDVVDVVVVVFVVVVTRSTTLEYLRSADAVFTYVRLCTRRVFRYLVVGLVDIFSEFIHLPKKPNEARLTMTRIRLVVFFWRRGAFSRVGLLDVTFDLCQSHFSCTCTWGPSCTEAAVVLPR